MFNYRKEGKYLTSDPDLGLRKCAEKGHGKKLKLTI